MGRFGVFQLEPCPKNTARRDTLSSLVLSSASNAEDSALCHGSLRTGKLGCSDGHWRPVEERGPSHADLHDEPGLYVAEERFEFGEQDDPRVIGAGEPMCTSTGRASHDQLVQTSQKST